MRPSPALLAAALLALARGAEPSIGRNAGLEETRDAVALLMELAAIPSESGNGPGVGRAAGWVEGKFEELGFRTMRLQQEGNPLIFAERAAAGPAPAVLFYMHYDTQPPGPPEDWASTGGEAFSPVLLTGAWDEAGARRIRPSELDAATLPAARLYARGASDDKAPIVMHLTALKEWLRRPGASRLHLKFLLDGEEEAGSPHIDEALRRHRDLLRADLLIPCDGPMDALGRRSVYLGTRGDMHMRLRVRTAERSGHSGNYGLLPNAAWRLATLLAGMKSADGRVTIEGFMEDVVPPTDAERAAMAEASLAEPVIARRLGVSRFEGEPGIPYYERLLFRPALIINHMTSGRPGNQIPVVAEALLEARLVTRQDPRKVFEAVRRHVQDRMPDAELTMLEASAAGRMDPADPMVARGIAAAGEAAGAPVLAYPSLGGTLPLLQSFEQAGHRYIGLPLVNFDNDQHVGNENLRVAVLPEGIGFLLAFYEALAHR